MPDQQEPQAIRLVADSAVPDGTVFLLPAGTPEPAPWIPIGEVLEDAFLEDAFRAERVGEWPPDWSSGGRIPPAGGDLIHVNLGGGCYLPGTGAAAYPPATPRAYAARATTPTDQVAEQRPTPAGGVDDITAAVDGLCACPCRQPIPPVGASAYFAGPDCQRRWHSDRATDPEQVYDRDDAAAYPRVDAAVVPLTRPGTRRRDRGRRASDAQARDRARHDPGLSFRRRCARCGRRGVPDTHEEVLVVDGRVRPPNGATRGRWQACPRCRNPFPGPAYDAAVFEEGSVLRLRLTDGLFWVSSLADLRSVSSRDLADQAWDLMVEQIAFRSRGGAARGMLAHDPVAVMDRLLRGSIDPNTALRITRL